MSEIVLSGIDGGNPLGFLAAVGVLRTAVCTWPTATPRMGWKRHAGAFRPVLAMDEDIDESVFAARIKATLRSMKDDPAFDISDDLKIPIEIFRQEANAAMKASTQADRKTVDFLAAFGADILLPTEKKGNIADTAFRTMRGSGHQHFLKMMRQLAEDTEPVHIHKTLFSMWRYDDPVKNHTLRWDPADDTRYALQWREPSGDPRRETAGSMWGANRLAIEALPLFPTAPQLRSLETTGFRKDESRRVFFSWPIWEPLLAIDTVRSVLALKELQHPRPDRDRLEAIGIVEVYRCQRITQGKFRNFSPAASV